MSLIRIIETKDGSHTLYREDIDETYHSRNGAIAESMHVFIKNGLQYFIEKNPSIQTINILEVGFGTGLNAALTFQSNTSTKRTINYVSLEPYPLGAEILDKINYFIENEEMHRVFLQMHKTAWGIPYNTNGFCLTKCKTRLQEYHPEILFDVVYFDAFAPEKQPELWTTESLRHVRELMTVGGILTTYCAKGQFRRDLAALGYTVEKLQGPPGGKREMTRAMNDGKPGIVISNQ